jgi:asparagine synthase (glutamine-hydrolysing)
MCGIAGIYCLDSGRSVDRDKLLAMVSTMHHRGPDAQGASVLTPWVGFGHARLAILDLHPESNQPFAIDDGDLTITFNGEVFNYIELRDELEQLGHRFRTRSDTEVILYAYKQWGPAALRRFNGMWGIAIYDRRDDTLFCARDRFGVKPFNYALGHGRFIFASEIKAILAAAPELATPNYDSLSRVLRASVGAMCVSTCFAEIQRLPPAHSLTIKRGVVKIERWWDFPEDVDTTITEQDAADGLREILTSAVRLRMRSDVPVGLTLSSGLDSSAIAATVRKIHSGPFDTFTAMYAGEPYDESARADAFSKSLGMTSNLIPANPDNFLETLRQLVWHLEMPIHTAAVFPLWNIARAARAKVTVLLEGQGADEALAGYDVNFVEAMLDFALAGQLRQAAVEARWAARTMGAKQALLLAGRYFNPPFLHKAYRWARGDEGVYVGPLANAAESADLTRRVSRRRGRLNASLVEQIEGRLVNLLHYGDAISMAHSIESRCPFLDFRLIEFATRLPGRYKFRDGFGKFILRRAMRDMLPSSIVDNRHKLGFPTPIARWFRECPEQTVYPVLRSPECRARGLFDPKMLDKSIDDFIRGRIEISTTIYRWILTELWFQRFIDRPVEVAPRGDQPLPPEEQPVSTAA